MKKNGQGEKAKNDVGIGFVELFPKAGLFLSNNVLTFHGST